MENSTVKCIVLLSGKRKSGKDYFSAMLKENFEKLCPEFSIEEVRLSAPLKQTYAEENNLDFERLLSADSYKEEHREKMIKFGEEKRDKDSGFWCRASTSKSQASVWIVVDCRRETDVDYFVKNYPGITISIRIQATDETRNKRGYQFTTGIDDFPSECGLDNYQIWDYILNNNIASNDFDKLNEIVEKIKTNASK